jgi:hypothetical protein
MDTQLTSNEINVARELLNNYAPAKHALDVLRELFPPFPHPVKSQLQ